MASSSIVSTLPSRISQRPSTITDSTSLACPLCTKAETMELHKKGVAAAAATVRGLSDAELDKSGTVLTGMPAMTTQQVVENILISHVKEHLGSIRATVGH